jgi:hypothetical protein
MEEDLSLKASSPASSPRPLSTSLKNDNSLAFEADNCGAFILTIEATYVTLLSVSKKKNNQNAGN